MQRQPLLDEHGMSIDQLQQPWPHLLRPAEIGTDRIERMADGDEPQTAFHCRYVVNAGMQRIGFDPGQKLRLQKTHRAIPCVLAAAGRDQTKQDQLLKASWLPDVAYVAVRISVAVRNGAKEPFGP